MIVIAMALSLAGEVCSPPTDTSRYRVVVGISQKAGTGASAILSETTVTGFMTLIQRDSAASTIAEFRIDSLKQAPVGPGKSADPRYQGNPSLANGMVFHARIVRGVPAGGFQLNGQNAHAKFLTQGLDNLFPGFKPTLKRVDTWSDTTAISTPAPVVQNTTTITAWKVTSLVDNQIVADGVSSGNIYSLQRSPQGDVETKGTMTGKRHLVGPLAGPMTTVSVTSEQVITRIVGTAAPVAIQVKTSVTITPLQ